MLKKISRRASHILIGIAVLFAVYNIVGFFVFPYALKKILLSKLPETLHREASIEAIRFNPYSFSLTIKGFGLKERQGQGTFIAFDELLINLQGRSLLRKALVIKEIKLVKPSINVIRNTDLSYNFSDLLPKAVPVPAAKAKAPAVKFSFNNIQITDGSVGFDDRPKKVKHSVSDINATIPFISNVPKEVDVFVKPSFSAKVNDAVFTAGGETKPFADTLETLFTLNLKDVSIPYYLAYSPIPLDYRFKSGVLGADLVISYKVFANREPELAVRGPVDFRKIVIEDLKGGPMVDLPSLHVGIASAELFTSSLSLSSIVFERPRVYATRDRNGKWNLMALVPKIEKPEAPEAEAPEKAGAPEKTPPPLVLSVDKIELQKAGFYLTDLFKETDFKKTLEPVDLTISGFSNGAEKPSAVKLTFKNDQGESASVDGNVAINPAAADLSLDISGIDLSAVNPYVRQMANIVITKGRASMSGKLTASMAATEGLKASYRGNARLSGLSVLDKLNNEVLLKWSALSISSVDADYNPLRVKVGTVELNDFYTDVIINKEGQLNLGNIMVKTKPEEGKAAEPPAKAATAGERPDIRVNRVVLKKGLISLKDRHIEPNFSADVSDIRGKVSGLSSAESKAADVDLSAKLNRYAPASITGRINPLRKDLFVDLHIALDDLDLSPMTPYSGRYAGYAIEKGKLFLNLKYQIDKRKLDSSNKVLIDQFNFGDRIESPVATKLPVRFAVNLLKDRQGKIDLDLPVTGSLDDPQFSLSGVIIKVIVNLIVKAATSPFALLGSLFGGGQDLGYVEFGTGSASITETSAKKLDALINALYNRPALKLDIEGYADAKADRETMREQRFTRSIKAEKFAETVKKGGTSTTIDDMVIGPKEYEKYLWLAYKKGKFRKPTNILGLTKKLPVPEMEKLLRENTVVTDDDLRELASGRANAVRDYIGSSGKVEPGRVFIVQPKSISPEKKENLSESRVEFKLE
jgi:uncharacterized protein DUF748